jgi:putative sigma-54 modulation protein
MADSSRLKGGAMEVTVKGRNISVTEALERYAFEKVERVRKFFDDEHSVSRAEVELTHERNPSIAAPQVAEATLFINGAVLKAREASEDMYASIDRMSDKLERQVRRYRGRQIDRWHGQLKGHSPSRRRGPRGRRDRGQDSAHQAVPDEADERG